jgi:hypothetical protein
MVVMRPLASTALMLFQKVRGPSHTAVQQPRIVLVD